MVIVEKNDLRLCTKSFIELTAGTLQAVNEGCVRDGLNIEQYCEDNDSWYAIISIGMYGKEVRGTIVDDNLFNKLNTEDCELLSKLYDIGIKLVRLSNEE